MLRLYALAAVAASPQKMTGVKLYSGHVGAIHRGHAQMRSVPQGAFELFKTEYISI